MVNKIVYWTTVLVGVMCLLILGADIMLVQGNQKLQAEVNQRQAAINLANNLAPFGQNLAQALAEVAVKDNDESIHDLLVSQGFTIHQPQAQPQQAAPLNSVPADASAKKTK